MHYTQSHITNMEKPKETATAEDPTWPELLGSNNWEGLLSPLNLSLRRLLLQCGDFCQCTYDAFNDDTNSKYAGSSRYGKKSFFKKVKFEYADDYQISCFLYGTATLDLFGTWDWQTSFIGYIATTTDAVSQALGRREIHVVWRGTKTNLEWIDVAQFDHVSAAPLLNSANGDDVDETSQPPTVMDGWLKLYTSTNPNSPFMKLSAREQLHRKLRQLLEEYKNEEISIVVNGHSLGAALATLSAFDIAENVVDESIAVAAIIFASPQVGDSAFAARLQRHPNLKVLHTRNKLDMIPLYPSEMLGYSDVGVELVIDCRKSPFLRRIPKDMWDWHNLQGILHVVAGWNGADETFELKVKRSLALVNKSCEFLIPELSIPGSWWSVENKGMVLDESGEWILAPPLDEDCPVPEFP